MSTTEEVDPFYDPEEEKRALEQGERNRTMRDRMRNKRKLEDMTRNDLPSGTEEYLAIPTEVVAEAPWRRDGKRGLNGFVALHEELLEFAEWVSLSEDERKKKERFFHDVEEVVRYVFGVESECVTFGSWYTGLNLPDSDLDVSLKLPPSQRGGSVAEKLRQLADRLLGEEVVEYVEVRDKARIPVLVIRKGDCEMDITMEEKGCARGTSDFIIKKGIRRYPHMRPLILLLKLFLQQRALQDTFTGGVGSYLLSCMVLAFLQYKESRGTLGNLTLGHLLFDFFTFYTKDLNTNREGLSVNGAGSRFLKIDRIFDQSTAVNPRGGGDLLCMESPLEPNIDIGSKCFQWRSVKQAFMQARLVIVSHLLHSTGGERILSGGLIDVEQLEGKLVDRERATKKPRR
jgi:non-canonical poly(A) RNA polymerase PAPD5/7